VDNKHIEQLAFHKTYVEDIFKRRLDFESVDQIKPLVVTTLQKNALKNKNYWLI
tara:strand:- start:78 stop:239 length:162 start_codon:yes stop_codon:yes gene_type:complete